MTEFIIIILMALGSALMLLAGVGVMRMPDLFTRMHVATKSATLGVGCILFAVAIFFGDLAVFTRAFLVVLFFLLTAPVGAHLIGRAGYIVGLPLWEGTKWDELEDKYDHSKYTLDSPSTVRTKVPAPDSVHARPDDPATESQTD
jgi:multicomponent Na+:H+ antiporter subunit G